jgi:hypothetical protein
MSRVFVHIEEKAVLGLLVLAKDTLYAIFVGRVRDHTTHGGGQRIKHRPLSLHCSYSKAGGLRIFVEVALYLGHPSILTRGQPGVKYRR